MRKASPSLTPVRIGFCRFAVTRRATWIKKSAMMTEAVTWNTGVAITSPSYRHPPGHPLESRATPVSTPSPFEDSPVNVEHPIGVRWPIIRVPVPPEWKRSLEDAAQARALSVAALVRQCIRNFMLQRHAA